MAIGAAASAASKAFTAAKTGGSFLARNAFMVGEGVMTGAAISSDMKQGTSFAGAVGKEVIQTAAMLTMPFTTSAIQLAPLAYQGIKAAHDFRKGRTEEIFDRRYNNNSIANPNFMDTNRALTMRQAAVQQIQGNKLNARSALGGEARIFAGRY